MEESPRVINHYPRQDSPEQEPIVAQASRHRWADWFRARSSALRLVGLTLILAFGAAFLALALFAYVADGVLEQETQRFDQGVLAWIRQYNSPSLDLAARGVTALGSEGVAALGGLLLLWCGRQRRWGAGAGLVLTVGGAQLLNDLIKQVVHRARPTPIGAALLGQVYSFPSGHAMLGMAFYGFAAYLGWRLLAGSRRLVWVVCLGGLVLLIGLSRLYLQVHYPTDVLAGYLAGFMWLDTILIGGHLLGARTRLIPFLAPKSRQTETSG